MPRTMWGKGIAGAVGAPAIFSTGGHSLSDTFWSQVDRYGRELPSSHRGVWRMTRFSHHALLASAFIAFAATSGAAIGQVSQTTTNGTTQPPDRPFGLFDRIFGGDEQRSAAPADPRTAQVTGTELVLRLDRLEAQIRQLTGLVEQLQYRNQQLEAQVKRSQDDLDYRFQELGSKSGRAPAPARPAALQRPRRRWRPPAPARRGDAFDPTQNPNAPGAPRTLGSIEGELAARRVACPRSRTDAPPLSALPRVPRRALRRYSARSLDARGPIARAPGGSARFHRTGAAAPWPCDP